jgi:uncharacterized metal-binding protein
MADGATHDRVGILIGLAAGAITEIVFPGATAPIMIDAIGGTLFLSPDLDVRDRKCKAWWRWNRYLKLGWYWNIYAALIPHHRHWLSHSPIVSTLIRAIFLGWPLVLIPTKIVFGIWILVFIGLEIATLTHLYLDGLLFKER